MEEVEVGKRNIVDDMEEDLDVCVECTGTWKVACYGAWCPNSQFWEDFLEDGWEEGAYVPRACCLRLLCGLLFCFFAPLWCCKAIFFVLFWPCICCCRALREGNCNRDYFRGRPRSKRNVKRHSQPLAYIESAPPSHPNEISHQFSLTRGIPPESPIPEIRIETELENGTYVTSPVEDSDEHLLPALNGHRPPIKNSSHARPVGTAAASTQTLPATDGRSSPTTTINARQLPNGHQTTITSGSRTTTNSRPLHTEASNSSPLPTNGHHSTAIGGRHNSPTRSTGDDPPPAYPMSESPRAKKSSHDRSYTVPSLTLPGHNSPHSSPRGHTHTAASKTMSSKARGMDNNLYRAVVMEGFQGITGKVTTV